MHTRSYLIFLILIILMSACKKEDDKDQDAVPTCDIIMPADSSQVQIGQIVSIQAVISGFSDAARVQFTIDSTPLSEDLEAPFEFLWDTQGWTEGPHTLRTDAYESGKLASDQLTIILIDTIIPPQAPVPVILITPETGNTDTIFSFDASGSYDHENETADLLFRWDFDGDGSWDTDYINDMVFQHKYSHPNNYDVRLEVIDTDSMTADTVSPLLVSHSSSQGACMGIVTVPHGGQVYHTVSIGYQCWLRENMNIGTMIGSSTAQTDNDTIEKYCYEDDTVNCEEYGGLYQWSEMMKYFPSLGAQGICPPGWHVPTDINWRELEAFLDSQYEIEDPEWDNMMFRGYDAGKNMKSLLGWYSGGNGSNLYDFKALPGGFWEDGHLFKAEGKEAHFWSSSHDTGLNAYKRMLRYDEDRVFRSYNWDEAAFSVRCIKNN